AQHPLRQPRAKTDENLRVLEGITQVLLGSEHRKKRVVRENGSAMAIDLLSIERLPVSSRLQARVEIVADMDLGPKDTDGRHRAHQGFRRVQKLSEMARLLGGQLQAPFVEAVHESQLRPQQELLEILHVGLR